MVNNKIIIQARMGSSRLPGKVIRKVGNKIMLDHIIDALSEKFNKRQIVIATTNLVADDIINSYAIQKDVECYRGDENNVASRFYNILFENPDIKTFFRVCADGPLIDTKNMILALEGINNVDFVTSMPNKGFPMGVNIELFRSHLFLESYKNFTVKEHFEHVTRYFYENIGSYRVKYMQCDYENYKYENFKCSVDTEEDFEKMNKLFTTYQNINSLPLNEKLKLIKTV